MVTTHILSKVKDRIEVSAHAEVLATYSKEVIDTRNIMAHIIEEMTEQGIIFKGKDGYVFDDKLCIDVRKRLKKHSSNFNGLHDAIKSLSN